MEVLNWGEPGGDPLGAAGPEVYHVLHLSCHARPGELLLEDLARAG